MITRRWSGKSGKPRVSGEHNNYGTSVGGFAPRRVSEVAILTAVVSTRCQIDSSASDITAIFSA